MKRRIDLTGKQIGRWTVLSFVGGISHKWLCRCQCGTVRPVNGQLLRNGMSQSCGCSYRTINGMSGSPTHVTWTSMINRCSRPCMENYPLYGGRGITVCERWKDFANFLADMGERPSMKHSIDRYPNKDGNYEPGNCRWATASEQNRNTRNNHILAFNGRQLCIAEWAEVVGIERHTIRERLLRGWTVEQALTTPLVRGKSKTPLGKRKE